MSQPVSNQLAQRSRVPRIAEAAVERARLTVVPRGVTRAPRVPFVALVSLLLVSGVAGLLLFNTSMQQASFAATAMEEKADLLDAREQSLQMDLERLRDPQRLAVQARAIGMVPPNSPAFLRLSDGKVLGNPTPALVEDGLRVAPLPTRKPPNLRPQPVILELPAQGKSHGHHGAADRATDARAGTKSRSDENGQQGSRR